MSHEDNEEESLCSHCNGSGEGQYDGTTCGHCSGSGVELVNDYIDLDDADWYYDQMKERELGL